MYKVPFHLRRPDKKKTGKKAVTFLRKKKKEPHRLLIEGTTILATIQSGSKKN